MFSLTRLAKAGYLLAFSVVVFLLVSPNLSQAQFGVAGGFRGTPALFGTIAIPTFSSSGSSSGSGGSFAGFAGGSGSSSGSFSTQVQYINLASFFPNSGRIIMLPPPTFMPEMTNAMSDTTGAPYAAILSLGTGGGLGVGGISMIGGAGIAGGGISGIGGGGIGGIAGGGGVAGIAGGGMMGLGGMMGMGGMAGMGGGMGGFAGKGFGGFNGKKPL